MRDSDVAREMRLEQAHIDRAYAALDRLREGADDLGSESVEEDDSAGGTFQERFERERRMADARRRAGELRWGDPPLVFGRIDFRPDVQDGERFHIGRIGVFDRDSEQLVVDWRAPVAEGFYRATRAEPLGLTRRRSFHCRGRRLLGIDDVILDATVTGGSDADDPSVVGEGALLASLAEPRAGRMRDAAATVQSEQDEVIRAPMTGITIVQGAAGTGKTVVALHRAAYLLYTYRQVLDRQGVLVLGPNGRFLDYVRDVLPALGEHEVRLATVAELYPGVDPVPEDPDVAVVKADLRMARVVRRAVRTRQRHLRETARVPVGRYVLKLEPATVNAVIDEVRGLAGTHNRRRRFVAEDLGDLLHEEFRRRNTAAPAPIPDLDRDAFGHLLARTPAFNHLLDRVWPQLSPQALLHDLFGSQPLLRHAARGDLLAEDEWKLLHRPRARRDEEVAWTDADVPLLHEAHALLGPLPAPPVVSDDPTEDESAMVDRVIEHVVASLEHGMDPVMEADLRRSVLDEMRVNLQASDGTVSGGEAPVGVPEVWGSVLVDEAQDLSPMAWRMVARSCPNQALTVVGDLAQGTRPWSPSDWSEVTEWIGARRPSRRHDLHVNYRTPIEIMEVAAPFAAWPDAATAVRRAGRSPRRVRATAGLVAAALTEANTQREAHPVGGVGIVAPDDLAAVLDEAVARDELHVDVHTPETVKGLEFDAVVVVEPARLLSAVAGTAPLYIALTRATQDLVVVHDEPLPDSLAAALG